MMKILSGAVAAGIILVVAGTVSLMVPSTSAAKQRPQPTFDNNAWIAYWDYDKGLKEAKDISSQLNSVSYFGGALDRQGQVIVLGPAKAFAAEKLPRYKVTVKKYLTVVNDVYDNPQDPKGQTKVKDTSILETILATQASRQAHIDDLFQTMKAYGYDGLEIDYEQVWKNPLVAFRYVKFIQEIAAAADEQQVPLRIILNRPSRQTSLFSRKGRNTSSCAIISMARIRKRPGPRRIRTSSIPSSDGWIVCRGRTASPLLLVAVSGKADRARVWSRKEKPGSWLNPSMPRSSANRPARPCGLKGVGPMARPLPAGMATVRRSGPGNSRLWNMVSMAFPCGA